MSELDPRLTPARSDIAADYLEGVVRAERFVSAQPYQVTAGVAGVRRAPTGDAEMVTQALHGEVFDVYDEHDGWGWGQSKIDGYVGYVAMDALSAPALSATHRVVALRTYVFSEPNLKSAPLFLLSLNADIVAEGPAHNGFVFAARAGWVFEGHVRAVGYREPDWVAAAERFVGAPYLWGGRESLGLDCSGLVQAGLHAAGMYCPRDADMQEGCIGVALDPANRDLARGDLVFWPGHVGIMIDGTQMLHANAHHMASVVEPLAAAEARIGATDTGPVRSIRRAGSAA